MFENMKEKALKAKEDNKDLLKVVGLFAGLIGVGYLGGFISGVKSVRAIRTVVPDGYELVKSAL